MVYFFGHVMVVYFLAKGGEKLTNRSLSSLEWAVLMVAAIFPDIDYLYDFAFGTCYHRSFTHSISGMFVMGLLFYWGLKTVAKNGWVARFVRRFGDPKVKKKNYVYLFMIGIWIHIFLDVVLLPGVYLLWPVRSFFTFYAPFFRFPEAVCTNNDHLPMLILVEFLLGAIWILWLVLRNTWFKTRNRL